MFFHSELSDQEVSKLMHSNEIGLTGHKKLKIYCRLDCRSGKRMLPVNRIFFKDEREAIKNAFRPCGHCMREAYLVWKASQLN